MFQIHSPPWQQKIFSSTIAAIGKQLKQSVNVFQSLMLYRLLPAKYKTGYIQACFLNCILLNENRQLHSIYQVTTC